MRSLRILGLGGVCATALLLAYLGGWGGERNAEFAELELPRIEEPSQVVKVGELPAARSSEDEPTPVPEAIESATREPVPPPEHKPHLAEFPVDFSLEIEEPPQIDLEIAGDISGQLVSEKGYWLPEELPATDTLIVELVRLSEPRLQLRADLETLEDDDVEGGLALFFRFSDVPVGDYELSLMSLGAWHWEPRSHVVRAPAAGVEFVRLDSDRVLPLEFEVVDAVSGEAIEEYKVAHLEETVSEENGVFMHAGPFDADSIPEAASFRWSVFAPGYRASFGDERAFVEIAGRRIARVELRPGWSTRFVVLGREPTLKPLARVGVRVDDRYVGATDHDGALVVELDEKPKEIEVDYKGWVIENDPFDPRPGTSADLRGHVSPLILRAPD